MHVLLWYDYCATLTWSQVAQDVLSGVVVIMVLQLNVVKYLVLVSKE